MAIFQPSNVIPSSFAGVGLGVVDVNTNINISWQVNGNSSMTAFQIQIYNNTQVANTTPVYDTGIITSGIPTGGFYGVDKNGNPKQFTYSSTNTWASWGLSNGSEYKMIITQYWGTNNLNSITEWSGSVFKTEVTPTLTITPSSASASEENYNTYKLTESIQAGRYYVVVKEPDSTSSYRLSYEFTIDQNLPADTIFILQEYGSGDVPYKGFYVYGNSYVELSISVSSNASPSPVLPADKGTLPVKKSDTQQFTITGSISGNTSLNWVEWNVYTYDGFRIKDLIYSTGKINTQIISLTTDIFQQNNFYLFECVVQTENGIEVVDSVEIFVVYSEFEFVATNSLCKNELDGSLQVGINTNDTTVTRFAIYESFGDRQVLLYKGNLATNNYINLYSLTSSTSHTINVYALKGNQYSRPIILNWENLKFSSYFLYETTQDQSNPNLFNVVRIWRFGNNISAGAISNNNTPNWLTNFTPYRLRQPSSRMGKSGTLQALLSNYNTNDNSYSDTAEIMNRLYQASQSNNTFFLKDIKGNLYMVGISSPISQTIETKSKIQQVTISLGWEEIGDASNVSLTYQASINDSIQEDVSNNTQNNNQNTNGSAPGNNSYDGVYNVRLNVSTSTGNLVATYPNAYVGTTFEIVNTNLVANTPSGINGARLSINNGSVIAQ